jgi:hypothetical protein
MQIRIATQVRRVYARLIKPRKPEKALVQASLGLETPLFAENTMTILVLVSRDHMC